ncbi:MAG: 3-hydroxyacyl-CoA dehydrogenase NAD-binding domain-containing protein [Casimicrobiaceae bacterium]
MSARADMPVVPAEDSATRSAEEAAVRDHDGNGTGGLVHWRLARADDGVARLELDRAERSTNTLSAAVLEELDVALDILERDPPAGLIIASGKRNGFIAGADVEEFADIRAEADALAFVRRGWDVFARLAETAYPTVALVRGFCLGGGLELALACRYRVVVDEPATRLGLPEVMLGILPGWGGIRRLPRLTGAPAALDLLLTGKSVDARKAKRLGIADACVPARIMENAARGMLRTRPRRRRVPFPLSLTLNPLVRRIVAARARQAVGKRVRPEHYPAPYAILDVWVRHDGNVLAAPASAPWSIPGLLRSPTTANLLRVFRLQERLKAFGKDGGFAGAHVHVVGAGTMGGDIAAWCALRGLVVTLQDQDAQRLAPAMKRAASLFRQRLKDPRRVRDALDRLVPDVGGAGIRRADIVIEAIFEDLEAKRTLFARLEHEARPDAILATNTSSIPLESIAAPLRDPGRLVGVHFFNPVASMLLVEVVAGADTHPATAARAAAFVRAIDRLPLPVASAPGFLVNRVLAPYLLTAMRCVDEGIAPEVVDAAALRFGMPMGPIELADTVGLDICMAVGTLLRPTESPPQALVSRVAAGKLGKKTQAGFYDWSSGRPAKQVAATPPAGLEDRLILPFVAAAKSALADAIVADADLVDAGSIFGTGFAPFRGGPLHYAHEQGVASARLAGA